MKEMNERSKKREGGWMDGRKAFNNTQWVDNGPVRPGNKWR